MRFLCSVLTGCFTYRKHSVNIKSYHHHDRSTMLLFHDLNLLHFLQTQQTVSAFSQMFAKIIIGKIFVIQ